MYRKQLHINYKRQQNIKRNKQELARLETRKLLPKQVCMQVLSQM